jgi:hypothetical protein
MREKRRALFLQYATYADADGTRAWPGKKRMCHELGVSMRTLDRLHADLKILGCISDATGPGGKIKLHGPRGTKERAVKPEALPLPGSSAWFVGPDGKKHRLKLTAENIGPLGAEIKKLLLGQTQEPVAPDTNSGAPHSGVAEVAGAPHSNSGTPHSTSGAPNSHSGAPKTPDNGAQPPRFTDTLTATPTATKPIGSTPGEGAEVVNTSGQGQTNLASRMITYIAGQLDMTSLPSTPQQRKELEALDAAHGKQIVAAATKAWCGERDITGLRFPLKKYLEEIPNYIRATVSAANAPPPGELPPMTQADIDANWAQLAKENNFDTVAEYRAWLAKLDQDCKYDAAGEQIMRELNLPEQGDEQ